MEAVILHTKIIWEDSSAKSFCKTDEVFNLLLVTRIFWYMDGLPKAPRTDVSGQKMSEPGFMVQDSLEFIISSVIPKY